MSLSAAAELTKATGVTVARERLANHSVKIDEFKHLSKHQLETKKDEFLAEIENIEGKHLERHQAEQEEREHEDKKRGKSKQDIFRWLKLPLNSQENALLKKMIRIRLLEILSDVDERDIARYHENDRRVPREVRESCRGFQQPRQEGPGSGFLRPT